MCLDLTKKCLLTKLQDQQSYAHVEATRKLQFRVISSLASRLEVEIEAEIPPTEACQLHFPATLLR